MGLEDLLVVIAAAALGALIAALITRRILSSRVRGLEADLDRSSAALSQREHDAREDRQVQDLILGSMQEGVLLFDGSGDAAFANEAVERHLGGHPSVVSHLYPPALRDAARRAGADHLVQTAEFERSEPTRWLRATVAPAGVDGSVLLVVSDVTETKRVEAVRRDFVANASHELKTPAASIQAAAETLVSVAARDPASVPRFASQLEREALRLSRIVADLLDLSRLESGSELGQPVRLDALVREEAERFEERCRESGLALEIDAPSAASVSGSARDLSLLVRNLVDNALRYTRPGGRIVVSVVPGESAAELIVADDGLGIPTRDLSRVFERFYRVDRARSRETGGTGLGLAIVKHVAENHGGRVEVTSELGRGSTFTVRLPSIATATREARAAG
jgi:two-component system, OmpR family, sensor histidine kinase SenX3